MDFIEICLAPKLLSNAEIRQFYLDQGQSAAQIARHFGVSRATIVSRLHDMGIRQEALPERYTNPENYRRSNPPYGYQIQDGKLVPNKAELRVCKLIVELIQRGGQNQNEVARELSRRGFKTAPDAKLGTAKRFSIFTNDGKINFSQRRFHMPEIIGAIVLVAITYGGTIAADEIHNTARKAALTKAAQGLPRLSTFAQSLTTKAKTHYSRK